MDLCEERRERRREPRCYDVYTGGSSGHGVGTSCRTEALRWMNIRAEREREERRKEKKQEMQTPGASSPSPPSDQDPSSSSSSNLPSPLLPRAPRYNSDICSPLIPSQHFLHPDTRPSGSGENANTLGDLLLSRSAFRFPAFAGRFHICRTKSRKLNDTQKTGKNTQQRQAGIIKLG